MVNKNLFKSASRGVAAVATDTVNEAGGKAYSLSSKAALAQIACTGTFSNTFYASAKDQLDGLKKLASEVEPEFIAKLAVYSRESAFMKDMPAYLVASLSNEGELFTKAFNKVVDSPKMIRNVVQILRSGEVGRKSLGSLPKRVVQQKLASYNDVALFRGSIGNSPSLADVIKMVHPRPVDDSRAALQAYLIGREYDESKLPELVRNYEAFKRDPANVAVPNVSFEMLTALPLTEAHWLQVATNATWTQTRMNLNTFARHGVFKSREVTKLIADKLSNPDEVRKARVFPYQLFTAYMNADSEVPLVVRNALQEAMEIAIGNVPTFECDNIVVTNDVSGSMDDSVTGHRPGATSKVTCRDVAALVASTILRRNNNAKVLPFAEKLYTVDLNPRDSIMTNAKKLSLPGGGTNCALPFQHLNKTKEKVDLIVMISDNQSWIQCHDTRYNRGQGTPVMQNFNEIKSRNPKCKLINIDITPATTSQTSVDKSILNIGGFSDNVFEVINAFVNSNASPEFWVKKIESIQL